MRFKKSTFCVQKIHFSGGAAPPKKFDPGYGPGCKLSLVELY